LREIEKLFSSLNSFAKQEKPEMKSISTPAEPDVPPQQEVIKVFGRCKTPLSIHGHMGGQFKNDRIKQ
jgi:hypothetical protein